MTWSSLGSLIPKQKLSKILSYMFDLENWENNVDLTENFNDLELFTKMN